MSTLLSTVFICTLFGSPDGEELGVQRKDLSLLQDRAAGVPLHQEVQLLKELVPSLLHVAQLFIHILNYESEMLGKICSCWRINRRSNFYRNLFQVFSTWLSSSYTSWTMTKKCYESSVPAGGSPGGPASQGTGSKSSTLLSSSYTSWTMTKKC